MDKEKKKTNRKSREYFMVDDEKVFDIVDCLKKKKGIVVDMITCKEIKITWLEKDYKREDILKMIS